LRAVKLFFCTKKLPQPEKGAISNSVSYKAHKIGLYELDTLVLYQKNFLKYMNARQEVMPGVNIDQKHFQI